MTYILHIETATDVCSVALSEHDKLIASRESAEERNHAVLLGVFIEELLASQNVKAEDLSAVSVSEGPGSYTGLRIGVSMAKGIAYGLAIPLIAVSTLQAMAYSAILHEKDFDFIVPMIDARRMEVYTSLFDKQLEVIEPTKALIVKEDSFQNILKDRRLVFLGTGAKKCKEIIKSRNAIFSTKTNISATNMIQLAYQKFKNKDFVDTAYFEPFYLKEFVAIKSKKTFF